MRIIGEQTGLKPHSWIRISIDILNYFKIWYSKISIDILIFNKKSIKNKYKAKNNLVLFFTLILG